MFTKFLTLSKRFVIRPNTILLVVGCEDLIADSITVDNLLATLAWSREPHGSTWVHRQALHFLQDEFLQVSHSHVLVELNKTYMLETIRSDFLQVSGIELGVSGVEPGVILPRNFLEMFLIRKI